jgi:hypothetical protein
MSVKQKAILWMSTLGLEAGPPPRGRSRSSSPVRLSNRRTRPQDAASQHVNFSMSSISPHSFYATVLYLLHSFCLHLSKFPLPPSFLPQKILNKNTPLPLPHPIHRRPRGKGQRLLCTKGPNQTPQGQVGNQGASHRLVGKRRGDRLPLSQPGLNLLLDRRLLVGVPVHGNDGGKHDAKRDGTDVLRRHALLIEDGC